MLLLITAYCGFKNYRISPIALISHKGRRHGLGTFTEEAKAVKQMHEAEEAKASGQLESYQQHSWMSRETRDAGRQRFQK